MSNLRFYYLMCLYTYMLQNIHVIVTRKHPELLDKWMVVEQTYNAFMRWNTANELLANPLTERSRAQLQADLPEYETYLPMFGEEGTKLLEKLRNSISSLQHNSAN